MQFGAVTSAKQMCVQMCVQELRGRRSTEVVCARSSSLSAAVIVHAFATPHNFSVPNLTRERAELTARSHHHSDYEIHVEPRNTACVVCLYH